MKRPLVLALMCLTFGIMLEQYCILPKLYLLTILLCTLSFGLYEMSRFRSKGAGYFLLSLFVAGLFLSQWQTERDMGNISTLAGHSVCIVGTICQEPQIRGNTVNYKLKVEKELLGGPYKTPLKGILLLTINNPKQNYDYGDRLEVHGMPEIPKETDNPGDFSYKEYLENQGIQLILKKWQGPGIRKVGVGEINPFVNLCLKAKNFLRSIMYSSMEAEKAGILEGILFGTTGGIDQRAKQNFAAIGVIHILSVSGYHVGVLVAVCSSIAVLLGFNQIGRTILIVFATLFYAIMTGVSPPVIRALIMAWVMILAGLYRKNYDWPSSLCAAALVILFFSPHSLYDAGFQLSFMATWGIFYLAPVIKKLLPADFFLKSAIIITISAQIAVFPITSYYFNYFSIVSLPANLIIVPIISIIMLLGAIAITGGIFWLPLAGAVNAATGLLIELVMWIARFLSGLPFATVNTRQPALLEVAAFYLILCAIVEVTQKEDVRLSLKRYWYFHKKTIITGGLFLIAVLVWVGIFFPGQGKFEVTFLNVGQGDCTFIKSPDGKYILVDTGGVSKDGQSAASFDPGEKILLPYLRRAGIDNIDLLVLTHPHMDHFGGAEALVGKINVDQIMISPQFREDSEGTELISKFLAKGTQIKEIEGGETIIFDENIVLEMLNTAPSRYTNVNNGSLIARVGYGDFHLMLTGDAEQIVLDDLAPQLSDRECDVVKVPHHGSRNAWSENFYKAVHPKLAVISVGPNTFGHPSKEVLEGLRKMGITIFRTDQQGAIIFISDGESYDYRTGKEMNHFGF